METHHPEKAWSRPQLGKVENSAHRTSVKNGEERTTREGAGACNQEEPVTSPETGNPRRQRGMAGNCTQRNLSHRRRGTGSGREKRQLQAKEGGEQHPLGRRPGTVRESFL